MKHPSLDIRGTLSNKLSQKRIILAVTGSVACVRSVDIARLLMRHGAEVFPVMSSEACRLIGPDLLEWATGHRPVTDLTGRIEHVALAGNTGTRADLLLIAPSTANTIGKIAAGVDDTPVTTFATTAIGQGIPVCIVPAMHEPMYRHPIVIRNLETLESIGLRILRPNVEEGKAKIPSPEAVLEEVLHVLASASQPMSGIPVLVTTGRTVEHLDPVRVLTNNSSGKMGMAVASACLELGAQVTVVYGKGTAEPPRGARVVRVDTCESMRSAVHAELGTGRYRYVFAAAAVGDWMPKEKAPTKTATHGSESLTLELVPTPKIIDGVRGACPDIVLVAFRAVHDLTTEELLNDAAERMKRADADFVAVNDVSAAGAGFEADTNEMHLIARDGSTRHIPMSSKLSVARTIVHEVIRPR